MPTTVEAIAATSLQRKRSVEDEPEFSLQRPPAKRPANEEGLLGQPQIMLPPSKFLPFHLQMIKSLYQKVSESEEEEEDDNNKVAQEGEVSSMTWASVEYFIKNRNDIMLAQKQAKDSRSVHAAALDCLGQQSSPTTTAASPQSSPNAAFRHTHTTSPANYSLHSPLQVSFTAGGSGNAFGLVALLLQKRASTLQARYQELVQPFDGLHHKVHNQIIATLTQETTKLQQALEQSTRAWRQQLVDSPRSANHTTPEPSDDLRSALAAAQTKLGLWKLLAQDLNEAMETE